MKKVLLALLGLILLTILSFFCFQDKADAIREDLISSTTQALQSNDLSTVHATLQGEDEAMTDIIQLSGEVPNLEAKAKAESITRAIPGVGSVLNQLTVQAKAGDRTQAVATTPEETTTPVAEIPAVTEPKETYALTIMKSETGELILEGYVGNKEQEDALLAEAKKLFPKQEIKNLLKIKKDAPKDWEHISSFALNKLQEVDYGDMKLHDQSYEFTGHLSSPSKKAEFLDGIRQVMSDPENKYGRYRGDYIITAPIEEPIVQEKHVAKKEPTKKALPTKPATQTETPNTKVSSCQQALDSLLSTQKVLFDYNKASLKSRSHSLLNKIASTIQSCQVSKVEIGGHTDNIGRESYNQKLSEKRANTVKAYLIKKGISADSLLAVGYGESHPIASNKTSKSRAKNRRIEFIVKEVK